MVPDEKPKQKPEELIRSFQILDLVAKALDQIANGADVTAVTPTITQLHQRIAACEKILNNLPGGDMTQNEQLAEIARLRDSLKRKRDLVQRYGKHDLIARVAMQSAIPQDDGDAADVADAADMDMTFPDVQEDALGVVHDDGDDVIMGLTM